MRVSIGTFNLNNLFSRFNFQGKIDELPGPSGGITLEFDDRNNIKTRSFMGRLVKCKDEKETHIIAQRILAMNVDVLAVQEVEHIEVLKSFNQDYLNNLYPHIALVEGNDKRLIDVAVMSKLPIGTITSHQTKTHPSNPQQRVFGRDLLAVEILNPTRAKKLFRMYVTHLKSHFVPFYENKENGKKLANERRQQQAEMIAQIIACAERPNSAYVLCGDMNDPPDSEFLQPMLTIEGQQLSNALAHATETQPAKAEREGPGPQTQVWTYRRNPSNQPPQYTLLDQIWLSPSLSKKVEKSCIHRRSKHGGDGSDHDPAWVILNI